MESSKLSAVATAVALSMFTFAAAAAEVDVRCEKRSDRSRISVDGNNLVPGQYRAVANSGGASVTTQLQAAVGDEAEFDFDSNRADIAKGATAIPANFIVDGRVKAVIVNTSNEAVTSIVEAICQVRR